MQRSTSQQSQGAVADACPKGAIGAERQAGDLSVYVDNLDLVKGETIWVNFEHVDLEPRVGMCRDGDAIVKGANVRDRSAPESWKILERERAAVSRLVLFDSTKFLSPYQVWDSAHTSPVESRVRCSFS